MTHSSLTILYALVAIGAAGLYGLMPRAGYRVGRTAAITMCASLAGLMVYGARALGWTGLQDFYFCVFGALALIGAIRVITHIRPVYSALYFVMVILSVAGLLVISDAEFLAAALVIIYAGAILVTYVFVIMLAHQNDETPCDVQAREPLAAVAIAFLLVACLGNLLTESPKRTCCGSQKATPTASNVSSPAYPEGRDNVREVGRSLMTTYVVAVEAAGVLLLVAMIAAIWVARRPMPPLADAMEKKDSRPLGRIGREVPPY